MYTPFDSGTNRKLAIILIAAGILLAPDFMVPTPMMDILLNVPLAIFVALIMNITFLEAMFLTYIFAYLLLAIGILIYPYNTKRLLLGRLRAGAAFVMANPFMVLGAVLILFILLFVANSWFASYEAILREHILNIAQQAGVT